MLRDDPLTENTAAAARAHMEATPKYGRPTQGPPLHTVSKEPCDERTRCQRTAGISYTDEGVQPCRML